LRADERFFRSVYLFLTTVEDLLTPFEELLSLVEHLWATGGRVILAGELLSTLRACFCATVEQFRTHLESLNSTEAGGL
jgi:hypothetical protein